MRALVLAAALLLGACGGRPESAEPGEALSGGDTTLLRLGNADIESADSFSQPAPNLTLEQRARFAVGNSFFTNAWIIAPASADARDGLGPLYNAAACQNCHIKDGRGHPPADADDPLVSLLLRVSLPTGDDVAAQKLWREFGAVPEPNYGAQVQNFGIPGVPPEARIAIDWQEHELRFADGETVSLRAPKLRLSELAYGPMSPQALFSLRLAQPMIGLGLLEMVPEQTLLALADPLDADGDGISGRPNRVWDAATRDVVLGRFGWKAGQPSVRQQAAAAFAHDIGISSSLFPHSECMPAQRECLAAPDGGQPEVSDEILDVVAFYGTHLAVPQRRWVDTPEVLAGKRLFKDIGCASCHTPKLQTGNDPARRELSNQTIRPYTDLLLHDMGPGLADQRPEFEADGNEWRTPPLWGIHLTETVGKHRAFLHDGRARTLMEAILWHGGEAQDARDQVLAMPKAQREQLIWFLKSL